MVDLDRSPLFEYSVLQFRSIWVGSHLDSAFALKAESSGLLIMSQDTERQKLDFLLHEPHGDCVSVFRQYA